MQGGSGGALRREACMQQIPPETGEDLPACWLIAASRPDRSRSSAQIWPDSIESNGNRPNFWPKSPRRFPDAPAVSRAATPQEAARVPPLGGKPPEGNRSKASGCLQTQAAGEPPLRLDFEQASASKPRTFVPQAPGLESSPVSEDPHGKKFTMKL
jgi:hypothetical protein